MDELIAKLKELGLTDEQTKKLTDQGMVSADDFAGMTAKELMDVTDCGFFVAKRIIAAFAPAPVAAPAVPVAETAAAANPTPAFPTNITISTGNPEDKTIQELLEMVAKGERSQDVTSVLRRKVGAKRRVYVRKPGSDMLDVAETMEMINQDFPVGKEPPFWGTEPTETLTEILQLRTYADPLTGDPLAKGDPWLKLGDDRMAAFCYARIKGNVLTGGEDKYTLVNEALAEPTGERWNKVNALWNRGMKSGDPQIMEARAAIIYRVDRGTNRHESEYRDRARASVSYQGGQPGTGSGFRSEEDNG